MKLRRWLTAVTLAFLGAGLPAGQGAVLSDNLTNAFNADFTFFADSPNTWAAQSFNSGNAYKLTRVELNLRQFLGGGTFFVKLYDSSAPGVPGTPVPGGNLASAQLVSGLSTAEDATWVLSGLSVGLTPNTDYFVVVGRENGSLVPGSELLWGYSSTTLTGSFYNQTDDGGTNWGVGDLLFPQRMRIDGDINTAPLLVALADITIKSMTLLSLSAIGSDADVPQQALSYSLLSSPTGMVISAGSGVITWTPAEAQAPSTNLVTVKVEDNGRPSLSATQSFTVVVEEAGMLSDNLYSPYISDLTFPSDEGVLIAQGFNSGSASELKRVELNLRQSGSGVGTFFVSLFDSIAPGIPGSRVEGGSLAVGQSIASLGVAQNDTWQSGILGVALATNSEYFVVVGLEPSSPVSSGLLWGYSDTGATGSSYNQSLDNGASWDIPDYTFPQRMRIVSRVAPVAPTNTAPVLTLPPDQVVFVPGSLSVTASAADADIPANSLTFSLVSPPAGMSIEPSSGLITWTPVAGAGSSTNTVTVQVTDSGTPPLSDTKTFQVVVLEVTPPVLFDNLASIYAGDYTFPDADTNVWVAQSFHSGSALRLNSLELNLYNSGTPSGTFFVRLHSAASPGIPGSPVVGGTLASGQAISALGTTLLDTWVLSGFSVPLVTNTEYFVVVGMESGSAAPAGLIWGYSGTTAPGSGFNQTADAGVNWDPADFSFPQRMKVLGSANTEPMAALPIDNVSGTYGATFALQLPVNTFTDPQNAALAYSASGMPAGIAFDGGTRTFSGIPTAVGSFPVQVVANDDGTPSLAATNSFTITINPAPATIAAISKSKSYGEANPALDALVTGTVGSDILNYTLATDATQFSGVGSHSITVTLGSNPNYTVTPTGNTLTVNPAAATIAANPKTRSYGEANPALDAVAAGTVNGDVLNFTLATTATAASGSGSYPITVTLGSNPNYSVTPADSTLTVGARAATIVANAKSKTFGTVNP
ncbi:MAG: MBG domain-containing protein, partial [Verrucomicrobia bacterium]|nr:MBG domain-containing protein [Verrucomicrobiota bacterium]